MTLSLEKGANLSLTKAAPSMKKAVIGLGWLVRTSDGEDFDLDASVFLLGANGKVRSDRDFIYYNQEKSACGSVVHMGDNTTGVEGNGPIDGQVVDAESIVVDLNNVPLDIEKIVVAVTIHEALKRRQNFGQVNSAYIRIVDESNNNVVAQYDLSEDAGTETSMIFGEVYRHKGEWKIRAVEQGMRGGLLEIARNYGVKL